MSLYVFFLLLAHDLAKQIEVNFKDTSLEHVCYLKIGKCVYVGTLQSENMMFYDLF